MGDINLVSKNVLIYENFMGISVTSRPKHNKGGGGRPTAAILWRCHRVALCAHWLSDVKRAMTLHHSY